MRRASGVSTSQRDAGVSRACGLPCPVVTSANTASSFSTVNHLDQQYTMLGLRTSSFPRAHLGTMVKSREATELISAISMTGRSLAAWKNLTKSWLLTLPGTTIAAWLCWGSSVQPSASPRSRRILVTLRRYAPQPHQNPLIPSIYHFPGLANSFGPHH